MSFKGFLEGQEGQIATLQKNKNIIKDGCCKIHGLFSGGVGDF